MNQRHRLDGHFIAISLQVGGLYLGRPRLRYGPGDNRLVLFIQELDGDVPAEFFLSFLVHKGLLPELEEFEIAQESTPLERDIAVLRQTGLFRFIVRLGAALTVFDGLRFEIEAGDLRKADAGTAPIQLEVKFR